MISETESLTPQERDVYLQILDEISKSNTSPTYECLIRQDFARPPVSPREFFTSEYFIGAGAKNIYPKWLEEMCYVCDPANEITEYIITGPIGGGKTTTAAHVIAYKLYYLSCLANPQDYYDLMPGHHIMIGLYNIFKYKVKSTSYHVLEEIITRSPYFNHLFKRNPKHTTVLEFPNDIGVITGSNDLQIMGENLYMLLLDEANFMKKGNDPEESQAYKVYSAAVSRMQSRFLGPRGIRPWCLIIVSSKKHESDFTSRRIREIEGNKHSHVSDFPLWELKPPGTFSNKRFRVQIGDALRASKVLKENEAPAPGIRVVEVPIEFLPSFEANIEQALSDIAGIATSSVMPLIAHKEKIISCIDGNRKHPFWKTQIYSNFLEPDPIEDYLDIAKITRISGSRREPLVNPHVPRFIHIDIGLTGDALGICVGHPSGESNVTRISQDGMPYQTSDTIVYLDFMLRIVPDGEIDLSQVRMFILFLRDSLGFQIDKVTYDGFQSRESIQLLQKCGINAELLSVDRGIEPYSILQRAILESRVSFYEYEPFIHELTNLILDKDKGKVDHPKCNPDGSKGSKDVCDAVAGVVYQCIKFAQESQSDVAAPKVEEKRNDDSPQIHPVSMAGRYHAAINDVSWLFGDLPKEVQKAAVESAKRQIK